MVCGKLGRKDCSNDGDRAMYGAKGAPAGAVVAVTVGCDNIDAEAESDNKADTGGGVIDATNEIGE